MKKILCALFVFTISVPVFARFDCTVYLSNGSISGYSTDVDRMSEAVKTGEDIIRRSGGGQVVCRQI